MGPKSLSAMALSLLLSGTLIGSAFSPPAENSWAGGRQVIIVQGPGTQAQGPAAPAPAADVPAPPADVATPPSTLADVPPSDAGTPPPTPVVPPVPPYVEPVQVGHEFVVMLPGDGTITPLARRTHSRAMTASKARVAADGDYLKSTLVPQGALLKGFRQVSQSSIANGIALVSGQNPNADTAAGCAKASQVPAQIADFAPGSIATGDGCLYPDVVGDLFSDVLSANGLQLNVYVETGKGKSETGMLDQSTGSCVPFQAGKPNNGSCWPDDAGLCNPPTAGSDITASADGAPDVRDDPMLWMQRYTGKGDCSAHVRPLERLADDLAADAADAGCKGRDYQTTHDNCMAAVNLLVPSRCRGGGAPKCPAAADLAGPAGVDEFLKRYVSGTLMASATYRQDGMIAITHAGADKAVDASAKGPSGALVISPFVKKAAVDTTALTTFDLLYTLTSRLGFGDPQAGATMLGMADPRPAKEGGHDARELPKKIYTKTLSPAVPD